MDEFDVVVVGAGVSGLAAARVAAEGGLRVVVLEAQGRVGGRILTRRVGDEVIELGAEFVHGRAAELWALIEEAGLATYERTGEFLRAGFVATEDEREEVLESLKEFQGPDCSFAEYVAGLGEEARAEAVGFVEGFNAADAGEVSALALGRQQAAEDAIEGERSWRVTAGYDQVPEFLLRRVQAAGGVVRHGAAVERVEWERGAVRVRCGDGSWVRAGKVVVAVPLGVLVGDGIEFAPEVAGLARGLGGLRMGDACRFTMVFGERLWPEEMSFLLTPETTPRVWWTARPAESLSLTGWVGGPGAEAWAGVEAEVLRGRVVAATAEALGVDRERVERGLRGFYTHDWRGDAWSRGAYSWVRVGGLEAAAGLSEGVEGTVYFAGEHTDTTGHWGTVHAALRSGLRSGRQVLGLC